MPIGNRALVQCQMPRRLVSTSPHRDFQGLRAVHVQTEHAGCDAVPVNRAVNTFMGCARSPARELLGEQPQDSELQSRCREHRPDHPADEPGFQVGDRGVDTGSFPPQLGADLGESGPELGGRDVGRPCSASFRIALAMTAAWSRSMPPAVNSWATESVSSMA